MERYDDFRHDLIETGAELRGHFLLTTGLHSPRFFLMARLGEHPSKMLRWGAKLGELLAHYDAPTVVGAALGGIIPAYAVAASSQRRVIFAEKTQAGPMALYSGALDPGEKVLVIEDAVATGSSIRKVMAAVADQQGEVVAIGALIHRGSEIAWPVPFHSVVSLSEPVPMWPPDTCPLCQEGIPLTRPKA